MNRNNGTMPFEIFDIRGTEQGEETQSMLNTFEPYK